MLMLEAQAVLKRHAQNGIPILKDLMVLWLYMISTPDPRSTLYLLQ